MPRTAIIYKPDESTYVLVLCGDTTPAVMRYYNRTDMISDLMEHLTLANPCITYGEEYSGDVHGLLAVISNSNGNLNIKYNVLARGEDIAEIFRGITIKDLI